MDLGFTSNAEQNAMRKFDMLFGYFLLQTAIAGIATGSYFYYIGMTFLANTTFAHVFACSFCFLANKLDYKTLAKDFFCTWSGIILLIVSLAWPGQKGFQVFFLLTIAQPFIFFELKDNMRRITIHSTLIMVEVTLAEIYRVFNPGWFPPLDSSFPDTIVNSVIWVIGVALSGSAIYLFNYLNVKINEKLTEEKRNQKEILDTIDMGLFTVDKELKIGPNYSRELDTILGKKKLEGSSLVNNVIEISRIKPTEKSQILTVLGFIGESIMNFEANQHFLPLRFGYQDKTLEMNWSPIDRNDQVDKVMITLRDVTSTMKLEEDLKKQTEEMEIVTACVKKDRVGAFTFLKESWNMLDNLLASGTDNINTIFITLHTIKGNARTFDFKTIADSAHEKEEYYARARSSGGYNADESKSLLTALRFEIEKHINVIEKYLGGLVTRDTENGAPRFLNDILASIIHSLPEMCAKSGLPAIVVKIQESKPHFPAQLSSMIKDCFTHLLRNSVAHGIEPAEKRKELNKPANGQIDISVAPIGSDKIGIIYKDDGRGLNLNALAKTLMPKTNVDDLEIAEQIFKGGVSTSETVDDISGRGVGMDAVRAFLSAHGASISVEFTGPRNSESFRPFIFRIQIKV